jgi:4-hydroxy-tetrahydrodipicolinate synthase
LRQRVAIGADFLQLSGEDATALPFLVQGGVGCISVTSNIAPGLVADMHKAWRAGDLKTAQAINERLLPVHDAMFAETSPGPVKYAASLMGLCSAEARLPMVPVSEATQARVRRVLTEAGLL